MTTATTIITTTPTTSASTTATSTTAQLVASVVRVMYHYVPLFYASKSIYAGNEER